MMESTAHLTMGDRGRIVLPADLRRRGGLEQGTPLVVFETVDGLVLMTREQLKRRVQSDHVGPSLIDELLRERRVSARAEDEGTS